MEKEANAQTEEETAEKTGKIQVSLVFNNFSCIILSFSVNLLSSRISASRYPQFLHCQMDHNGGRQEAQKTLVEPHFGQNFTFCVLALRLNLGIFASANVSEDLDFRNC
jgi:hypothetical protein